MYVHILNKKIEKKSVKSVYLKSLNADFKKTENIFRKQVKLLRIRGN